MGRRVELQAGDVVGDSSLIYVRDTDRVTKQLRRLLVRCPCGIEFATNMCHIVTGKCVSCPKCGRSRSAAKHRHDLRGRQFGRLTPIERVSVPGREGSHYICTCTCGTKTAPIPHSKLTSGHTTSCGCYGMERRVEATSNGWNVGDIVGHFLLIEVIPGSHTVKRRWVANNLVTNNIVCMTTNDLNNQINPLRLLQCRLRSSVRVALLKYRIYKEGRATQDLIGISAEDILKVIGHPPDVSYHLDHICPLSQALDEHESIKLFNPSNLRWLPAADNLRKSDSHTPEGEELCRQLLGREWQDKSLA